MMPSFIMALAMGLTGSLHCVGMCGPIMMFLPFYHFTGARRVFAIGLYHFARISVYALMAFTIYSFREAFNPQLQQAISIGLGSILLIAGIVSFFPLRRKWQLILPWTDIVKKQLGRFMGDTSLPSIAVSGMLNGMLPCGLVYMALSATLALHSPAGAVLFMYFFGIGTLPALISIVIFKNRIAFFKNGYYKRFTPIIIFSFGCVFLLRGLNLGIPYLSPKVQVANGQIHSCCHKK